MTSKIVVNNIEADAGVSTVTFQSEIQRGTSNLHSTGIEIANINDTGVVSGYDTSGMALDSEGNIYVAENDASQIFKINTANVISVYAGINSNYGALNSDLLSSTFSGIAGMTFDSLDNLYVVSYDRLVVRKLSKEGQVTTVAGIVNNSGNINGQSGTLSQPNGIAVDQHGDIYITQLNGPIRVLGTDNTKIYETDIPFANDPNFYAGSMTADNAKKTTRFIENCNNFIFSSSASIYRQKKDLSSFNENADLHYLNPYSHTKLIAEQIIESMFKKSNINYSILRYFNPAGAHESNLIGEESTAMPNNLFPYICKVATGKLPYLKVFGNDYETKDGTCIRDYIHVMDLAQGHLLAMEYLLNSNPGIITLNLGTGKGTSVIELIEIFQDVNKIKIPYDFAPRRKGDHNEY